jgi:hypothetical protein
LKKIENKENKEMLYCLNKLLISCLNIIFFVELSSEIKEENTNLDILINCIDLIITKMSLQKLSETENTNTLGKIFYEMNIIYSGFENEIGKHLNEEINKKYNYIFLENDEEYEEDGEYLKKKIISIIFAN